MFANSKKVTTFAPAIEREILDKKDGPFVYRLGRKIFILERGVRFPHGLPNKKAIDKSMAFLFLPCFVQGIQYSREPVKPGSRLSLKTAVTQLTRKIWENHLLR